MFPLNSFSKIIIKYYTAYKAKYKKASIIIIYNRNMDIQIRNITLPEPKALFSRFTCIYNVEVKNTGFPECRSRYE